MKKALPLTALLLLAASSAHAGLENGMEANVVLGQPDFTQGTANNGGLGPTTMNLPYGVFSDGRRLFVADVLNHRVLIWNSIPTANFTPADVVLGQPNFASNTANNGGIGASTMNLLWGNFSDGRRLIVSDQNNHRVLIWNSIPTSNFTPADIVLGQPDFIQNTANNGGRKANSINSPRSVFSDGRRLFIADSNNHRLLIFHLASGSGIIGPQFTQGKAVVGKVFWDGNGNGVQDESVNRESSIVDRNDTIHESRSTIHDPRSTIPESGIEGVKIVSDTGIWAITDSDGKYHFPYIETGQRILKVDPITLPEGATLTTESPRKIVVTEGVLSKVSFGVKPSGEWGVGSGEKKHSPPTTPHSPPTTPLLKATITQDPVLLKPKLSVKAERQADKIIFFIDTNYPQFIQEGALVLYDKDMKPLTTPVLPTPLPYYWELKDKDLSEGATYYQFSVYDKKGKEDRASIGKVEQSQTTG